jgi:hypothetical protein
LPQPCCCSSSSTWTVATFFLTTAKLPFNLQLKVLS